MMLTSAYIKYACSTSSTCVESQASLPVGQVHVVPLEGEDLAAATVVLTRSFTTSPDSVTVSLSRVEYDPEHAPTYCPQKPSTALCFILQPAHVNVRVCSEFLRKLQDPSKNGKFFVARLIPTGEH